VTYSDSDPVTTKAPAIADALQNLAEHPATHEVTWPEDRLDMFSARSLAHELAKVFDTVSSSKRS
jgi:hypothetical protein